jgi:hypothetical protein
MLTQPHPLPFSKSQFSKAMRLALAAALATSLCGCGGEAKPKKKRGGGGESPAAPMAAAPTKSNTVARASDKAAVEAFANYKPFFPNRLDPFAAPSAELTKNVVQAVIEPGVFFKGVVDVDGPKAILSINGRVYFVGEGETSQEVEVVKLDGNQVTLRRNGKTWIPSDLHEGSERVLTKTSPPNGATSVPNDAEVPTAEPTSESDPAVQFES